MMKFGKKLLAVVLAAVLALTMLTACGTQGSVDLGKSKEILEVVNDCRTKNGKGELTLSEEASQQLAAWAKAAAAQNANPTKATLAATENAKSEAKEAIKKLTIDGKTIIKTWETYSYSGTTADAAKAALLAHPDWFWHDSEDDCNYVAIATYGSGKESATVVMMLKVK